MSTLYRRSFLILYAAHVASALSILCYVLLPLRIQELGGDDLTIGWLAATAVGVGVAVRWISGPLADRLGRRAMVFAGLAIGTLASIGLATIDDLGIAFYVVRAAHGAAAGILFAAFFTIASDLAPPERRAEGLAVFGTSGILAGWLGPFVGERMLAWNGWDAFFGLAAGAGLLAMALIVFLPETGGRGGRRRAVSVTMPGATRVAPGVDAPEAGGSTDRKGLWTAFGFTFLFGITTASYFTFLAPRLQEIGGFEVSDFFLVYAAAALALRVLGRRVPDRIGVRWCLPPAMGSLLLGVALLGLARGTAWLRLAGLLCGLGHGWAFPLLNTVVVRRAPAASLGFAVAVFTAVIDVGALLGSPLFGALADRRGYAVMFVVASLAGALGLVLLGAVEWERARRATAAIASGGA